jgi:hypothetical protein
MHAAHELSALTYAHAILKTADVLAALPKALNSSQRIGD